MREYNGLKEKAVSCHSCKSLVIMITTRRNISATSGDVREGNFLFQRVSVLLQRYNAVLLHDTLPTTDCTDDLYTILYISIFKFSRERIYRRLKKIIDVKVWKCTQVQLLSVSSATLTEQEIVAKLTKKLRGCTTVEFQVHILPYASEDIGNETTVVVTILSRF